MTREPRPGVTWFILLATILTYTAGNPQSLWLWPLASPQFHAWQLASHALCHGNGLHLAVNAVALLSFGPSLERAWGHRLFAALYVLCAVAGGFLQASVAVLPVVGASGALFGLFAAYTIQNPRKRVISLFPWPLPAWAVLAGYLSLSALAWAFHWVAGVAHLAHLGGALMGIVCVLIYRGRVE